MGHNTRDRSFEAAVRQRAVEVRQLDRRGQALHLIVTGTREFRDWSFVFRVLDRIHRERGLARVLLVDWVAVHAYASHWARSRGSLQEHLPLAQALRGKVHGMVVFGAGPVQVADRAALAGLVVWRVVPRPFGALAAELRSKLPPLPTGLTKWQRMVVRAHQLSEASQPKGF